MNDLHEVTIAKIATEVLIWLKAQYPSMDPGVKMATLKTAAATMENAISAASHATVLANVLNGVRK